MERAEEEEEDLDLEGLDFFDFLLFDFLALRLEDEPWGFPKSGTDPKVPPSPNEEA